MSLRKDSANFLAKVGGPGALVVALVAIGVGTLTLKGVDISAIFAAATSSLSRPPVTLFLTPYDSSNLTVGEVRKIDVQVNANVAINAVGTTIKFPQDSMEILGFSKEKSFFDLWTEETSILEDVGEIHFSGGTTLKGGLIGTGTILTLTIRPKKSGAQSLYFQSSQVYLNDGQGTLVDSADRAVTFDVREQPNAVQQAFAPIAAVTLPSTPPENPQPPTGDVNTDGAINLVDVSIMFMRLVMPYDFHFDLNQDGAINIADVSIVLAKAK